MVPNNPERRYSLAVIFSSQDRSWVCNFCNERPRDPSVFRQSWGPQSGTPKTHPTCITKIRFPEEFKVDHPTGDLLYREIHVSRLAEEKKEKTRHPHIIS